MNHKMVRRRVAAAWLALPILGLVVSFAEAAHAAVITYSISGTVGGTITDESADHYVPTSITDGSTFTGTISFNNAAPGSVSGGSGYYRGTALDLNVNIVIDGQYDYQDTTPSASDEIDLLKTSSGMTFGLYKRGPVVATDFTPDPPFSHLDFLGTTQTDILSNAQIGNAGATAGVGDAEASGSPYYYIGANLSTVQEVVPEPSSLALLAISAIGLVGFGWLNAATTHLKRGGPNDGKRSRYNRIR